MTAEESLDGSDGQRSIASHVSSVEGKEQISQRPARALDPDHLATHRRTTLQHTEIRPLGPDDVTCFNGLGQQHTGGRWFLAGQHHRRSGLDDARLLSGDLLQ